MRVGMAKTKVVTKFNVLSHTDPPTAYRIAATREIFRAIATHKPSPDTLVNVVSSSVPHPREKVARFIEDFVDAGYISTSGKSVTLTSTGILHQIKIDRLYSEPITLT